MKIFTKSTIICLLIINLLSSILCDEKCGTPAECYIKAVAMLNQARTEIRAMQDKLNAELVSQSEMQEAELKSTKQEFDKTINVLKSQNQVLSERLVNLESKPAALSQCEYVVCDIGDWGKCKCPGNKKILHGGCQNKRNGFEIGRVFGESTTNLDRQTWSCGGQGGEKAIALWCCEMPY